MNGIDDNPERSPVWSGALCLIPCVEVYRSVATSNCAKAGYRGFL